MAARLCSSAFTATTRGRIFRLGPDFLGGHVPQGLVPPRAWQSARSLGAWSLAGCTVAPGFDFEQFELAPKDWQPE